MQTRPVTSDGYLFPALLVILVGAGGLALVDLWVDVGDGVPWSHVAAEGLITLAMGIGALLVLGRLRARAGEQRKTAESLARRLAASDRDGAHWRREAQSLLRGLGAAIAQQFEVWHLSAAEKEVALLLLKGLSHKEIARHRGVSEATARQQARAVYRKAGLSGRRDLAAYFLEDIALPAAPRTTEALPMTGQARP